MTKRERQILNNAINRLPAKQADALGMRIWNGAGIGEIAEHFVMDWEEAWELLEETLSEVEHDLLKRKVKIEEYPLLFEALEEAA